MHRTICATLLVWFLCIAVSPARAEWIDNGTPICTDPSVQELNYIIPDDEGGAFIMWRDRRDGFYSYYIQKITADGDVLWTTDGIPVCPYACRWKAVVAITDHDGGIIVTFLHREDVALTASAGDRPIYRDDMDELLRNNVFSGGGSEYDVYRNEKFALKTAGFSRGFSDPLTSPASDDNIYAQKIDRDGLIQWADTGIAVCRAPGNQWRHLAYPDGEGGAIIVWDDYRDGNWDIYAQRIDADGNIIWQEDGVPVCTTPENQAYSRITTDGMGGAVISWKDFRDENNHVYLQRIDSDGTLLLEKDGRPITTTPAEGRQPVPVYIGPGEVIVSWVQEVEDGREIRAQKIDLYGNTLWPAEDIYMISAPSLSCPCWLQPDRRGGIIVTVEAVVGDWEDYNRDIFAQRLDGNGNVQWGPAGIPVIEYPEFQNEHMVVGDGAGGTYVFWKDSRNGRRHRDIYGQWIRASGELMWEADGRVICDADSSQRFARGISDRHGGAMLCWIDERNEAPDDNNYDIYAWRVFSEMPIEAHLDIRPGSCPNPLNPKSRGVLPVAILGTEDFDVTEIDRSTILLEGAAPLRCSLEDVATPAAGEKECTCTEERADGYQDLTLKFRTQEIINAIDLESCTEVVPLKITGKNRDGKAFEGYDCVFIVGNGHGEGLHAAPRERPMLKSAPSDPVQIISFEIPARASVEMSIYNVAGRLVKRIVRGSVPAGVHTIEWDASNVQSGIYFMRIRAGAMMTTGKIVLVR